jgi:hypothetical protein
MTGAGLPGLDKGTVVGLLLFAAAGGLAAADLPPGLPGLFSQTTYLLVPYSDSELLFTPSANFSGQATNSWIADSTGGTYSGGQTNRGNFAFPLIFQSQVTDLQRDLGLKISLDPYFSYSFQSGQQQRWNIPSSQPIRNGDSSDSTLDDSGAFAAGLFENWYWGSRQLGWAENLSLNGAFTESQAESGHPSRYVGAYGNKSDVVAAEHLELRAGFGRRVETRWAWNALETVNVLRNAGLLLRPLSDGEMQDLAGLLAQIGSEYAWDFRDQRLRDTHRLWNFLTNLGCLAQSNPESVVVLSDTYLLWTSPRLRGQEALVVAEADDAAARFTGYNVQPFLSNYGTPDYFQSRLFDVAPGLAVQADWSRPLDRQWQFDAVERLDYRPYQDGGQSPEREATFQNLASNLSLDVGYFPTERLSAVATDIVALNTAQVEDWSMLSGGSLTDSYHAFNFTNTFNLNFTCAYTYLFSVSLSGDAIYGLQSRWASFYAGTGSGPGQNAFNAYFAGQPYNTNWDFGASLSATYRLF